MVYHSLSLYPNLVDKIYEKHFTLDRTLPGPDHRMSLNPAELAETVKMIRLTESCLGKSLKQVLKVEEENRVKMRKSLVFNLNLTKGAKIKPSDIGIKRPGSGLSPKEFENIIGRELKVDVYKDQLISTESFN